MRLLDAAGKPLISAHRLALWWAKGPPPDTERIYACHRCNNTLCVNPVHLYWGTASQNNRDKKYGARYTDPADMYGDTNTETEHAPPF